MSLGDRCDEIVRLIDETLAAYAAETAGLDGDGPAPAPARSLGQGARRLVSLPRWPRLRGAVAGDGDDTDRVA